MILQGVQNQRFITAAVAFTVFAALVGAQPLGVKLEVDSRPSPFLAEWQQDSSLRCELENRTDSMLDCKIEFTISRNSQILVFTPLRSQPVFVLAPRERRVLGVKDLLQIHTMRFFDETQRDLRAGLIPQGGEMIVCLNFFDSTGRKNLCNASCETRTIEPYRACILRSPADGDTIHGANLVLRWSAVQPLPKRCLYHLRIYRRDSEQFVAQVVRTHEPIVDTVLDNVTELNLKPSLPKAEWLVWQIQCSGPSGYAYGGSDGYSSIQQFYHSPIAGAGTSNKKRGVKKAKR